MPTSVRALLGLIQLLIAGPLAAEVTEQNDQRFVVRAEAVVKADLKATWLALIQPSTWWNSEHTWSGDAANLSIVPQGGGCFCERIPEVDEPGRFTLEGSVEHMRVVQAYPEQALRMVGALGPLQSEPVIGVLTIALSEVETESGKGTRIVWEYHVGGPMRFEVPVISKAVDGVMSLQLGGLAKVLGPAVVGGKAPANSAAKPAAGAVENPTTPKPAATQPAATTAPKPAATAVPQPTTAAPKPAATSPAPKPTTTTPAPKADPRPAPKRETVDEAFKDFKDDGAR